MGERVGGHLAESGPGGICRTHRVDTFAYFSSIFRSRPEVPDRLARHGRSKRAPVARQPFQPSGLCPKNRRKIRIRCYTVSSRGMPVPAAPPRARAVQHGIISVPHLARMREWGGSPKRPAAGSRCQKATSTRDEHRAARSGTRLVRHVGCTHSTGPSRPGQCGHDEKLQVRRRESLRPRPLPSRLPLASGLRKAARAARPSSARGTTSTHARVEAR